jgi:hypothetical protein
MLETDERWSWRSVGRVARYDGASTVGYGALQPQFISVLRAVLAISIPTSHGRQGKDDCLDYA